MVADFPAYEVSTHGRLRRGDRFLKGSPIKSGHIDVSLHMGRKRFRRYIHTLVLEAFIGPRPDNMEACHWDGDPANNRLDNLRWDTHANNVADTVRHGRTTRKERCVNDHPLAGNQYPSNGACITCVKDRARRSREAGYIPPSRRKA